MEEDYRGSAQPVAGSGLDFGARMLDPRLGRWMSLDPRYAKSPSLSPYNAMANAPTSRVDPFGERDTYFNGQTGSTGESNVLDNTGPDAARVVQELNNEYENLTLAIDAKGRVTATQSGGALTPQEQEIYDVAASTTDHVELTTTRNDYTYDRVASQLAPFLVGIYTRSKQVIKTVPGIPKPVPGFGGTNLFNLLHAQQTSPAYGTIGEQAGHEIVAAYSGVKNDPG